MSDRINGGKYNSPDVSGGSNLEWSQFANGETARRRRVVDCTETAPMQPEYSDSWANSSQGFAVKGPDLFDIQRRSGTDGNG